MPFLDWLATVSPSRERQLRRAFAVDHQLAFDGFRIALPPEHALPRYRRVHPTYDRFLPELTRRLPAGGCVVDVGANCADTVAAMAEHDPGLHYVCIEADDTFFAYLRRNLDAIRAARPQVRITALQAFVGREVTEVTLAGGAGSRHAAAASGGGRVHRARSLDDLLDEAGATDVRLIKTDVDGYDYDILDSATRTITRDRPMLFFECQHGTPAQVSAYRRTIDTLAGDGYDRWTVFDNFGGLVLRTDRTVELTELMAYVQRQNEGRGTRTLHYLDILASTAGDEALVERTLQEGASGAWRG